MSEEISPTDEEIIDRGIRCNLQLIKTNNRLNADKLIFNNALLTRGIEILRHKNKLTDIERNNLLRFLDKWEVN